MQLTLSTSFQPDYDTKATVVFKEATTSVPVAEVHIDYDFEGTGRHRVVIADLTRNLDLDAVTQMKIGLAAAELIDSFITSDDAPSRIEV